MYKKRMELYYKKTSIYSDIYKARNVTENNKIQQHNTLETLIT